jgi:hypothetical protein
MEKDKTLSNGKRQDTIQWENKIQYPMKNDKIHKISSEMIYEIFVRKRQAWLEVRVRSDHCLGFQSKL